MQSSEPKSIIPTHLGFIIDGNRRWAKRHGIPTYEGHLAGYNAVKEVALEAVNRGIQNISVYLFSTENWKRAESEISYLMGLIVHLVKTDLHTMIENEVRLRHIGAREGLPKTVLKALGQAEEKTSHFTRGTVGLCINYGGHKEIADAARQCIVDGLPPESIDERAIASRLYAPDLPPLDMVVRTSGEERLSNFMLWRAAYSEFMFIDKLWPDMTKDDLDDIIKEYNTRQRRFGGN